MILNNRNRIVSFYPDVALAKRPHKILAKTIGEMNVHILEVEKYILLIVSVFKASSKQS